MRRLVEHGRSRRNIAGNLGMTKRTISPPQIICAARPLRGQIRPVTLSLDDLSKRMTTTTERKV